MSQTNIRTEGVAVVSGANRGIGLEVARELGRDGMTVLLGAREAQRGEAAAAELTAEGLDVRVVQLDVTDAASVDALRAGLERVDVLVNNAGILPHGLATELDPAVADAAWQTNALGAWRLALAVIPLMRERSWGRIVNVSSGAGSLADMSTYEPPYSVSKAALNAITRVLAGDLQGTGILVNSVCPGWVQTDMGGAVAPRTVQQGAASVMWAVRLPDDGPSGGFFRDGEPVPW
jgi:NAD(P)-dependent dehydrogenase (short-subunit alcohol dehydrogenase family)